MARGLVGSPHVPAPWFVPPPSQGYGLALIMVTIRSSQESNASTPRLEADTPTHESSYSAEPMSTAHCHTTEAQ